MKGVALKVLHACCICLGLLYLPVSCRTQSYIPAADPQIRYEGRVAHSADHSVLAWPGTSVFVEFEGTGIAVKWKDSDTANYYNVIVDDSILQILHPDTSIKTYVLAEGLKKGKHQLQLFKRTEWDKGSTFLYGFQLPANSKLLPPTPAPTRKIEFFGNSITCGYAIEDSSGGDSPHGYFENNYRTYDAITARHFKAQYHCTSKSGIGILISWFPLIMQEMYDRLNPTDSNSKWDFKQYTPDLVVVNLFQNDSWLVKKHDHPQFKYRFGTTEPGKDQIIAAYARFIRTIRSIYPKAKIICALGNMDATHAGSPWPGYVAEAVQQLKDNNIYTHFFPYKNTGGHPSIREQQAMADELIPVVKKIMHW